jgi:hypothetical protein
MSEGFWPDDDPRWDQTVAITMQDGSVAVLPGHTVRDALMLIRVAHESDEPLGGEIDPREVLSVRPATEDEIKQADRK